MKIKTAERPQPDAIINVISNLEPGCRAIYYKGTSGWLDLAIYRPLKTWLTTMEPRYIFTQRKSGKDRFGTGVYEYIAIRRQEPEKKGW